VWFGEQGYETQTNRTDGTLFLQAAKNEAWRKAVGASRAFNLLIQGHPQDFSVELSIGEWASNLAAGGVAALLTGGATLLISGVTAGWSKKIEGDLWSYVDQKVMFGEKAKSVTEIVTLKAKSSLQEKLQQLRDAYEQGFIDEVAYNTKRLGLEGNMRSTQQDAQIEDKLLKLKSLLDSGILSQGEFEMKKAELLRSSSTSELDAQISRLNAALNAGILTQDEYEIKKAAVEQGAAVAGKMRQLENARDAGIITFDEFEEKKIVLMS
jgi:Short C-terminal domain